MTARLQGGRTGLGERGERRVKLSAVRIAIPAPRSDGSLAVKTPGGAEGLETARASSSVACAIDRAFSYVRARARVVK